METYILQKWCKENGFDPIWLDGDRGGKTNSSLKRAFNSLVISREEKDVLPLYAKIAKSYDGVKEVDGKKSNPIILEWIRNWLGWGDDDSTIAWCAIFMNQVMKEAGIEGTGKANAKSFLSWGTPVDHPRKGDVVIFDRGTQAWQGHVGIYMGEAGNNKIWCLGGNQSNRVSVAKYSKSKLRGYRRAI